MVKPASGLVIRYHYLWAREFERGEESGRKSRPVCVEIVLQSERGTHVALFPITTQAAHADRIALAIPEIEARRAGLSLPSWVIVDELNLDDLARSPHVADSRSLGSFSPAFVRRIRVAAADAIKSRKHRAIPRR